MLSNIATIAANSNRVRQIGTWTHMRLNGGALSAIMPAIEALAACGVQVQVCTRTEVRTARVANDGTVTWTSRPAKLFRHTPTVRVAEVAL